MRLTNIQDFLRSHGVAFQYFCEDDCGTINFIHHGLSYHIWEYPAPERGAQSNVRSCGRTEDFDDDYEEAIIDIMKTWW